MKFPSLLGAFILCALPATPARAEIIGVEQFAYPNGAISGQNGGTFWDWKNTAPTAHTGSPSNWDVAFGTPGVSGGQLVTDNSGARREYNGNTETSGAVNDFNDQKVVYYRATITTGATLPEFFYFMSDDFGAERVLIGKMFGSSAFGVAVVGNPAVNSSITIQPNTTYTLVAKISYSADTVSIFVNPSFTGAEPAADATAAFPNTNWSTAVRVGSGFTGDPIQWENLVVATTWEDLRTVVTTTTDEDDGILGGGTGISLREAVAYSPSRYITFAPALSGQKITLTHPSGQMLFLNDATIDARPLSGGLTVDGNETTRHFEIGFGRSLVLLGLTLTRGSTSGDGGAIFSNGRLLLDGCTLTANRSGEDGGAVRSTQDFRALGCTVAENSAEQFGGGIYVSGGSALLNRCTLAGNAAFDGGALFQQGSSATRLVNSTVSGNRSTGGSTTGGITALTGTLTLDFCTISLNSSSGGSGGLYLQSPASVELYASIIAANTSPGSIAVDVNRFSGTLTAESCLIGDGTSTGLTHGVDDNQVGTTAAPLNPKLSPLGHFGGPVRTMHPLIGSPAIDAVADTTPSDAKDGRGFPGFVDGDTATAGPQYDIGAVEAGPLRTVAFNSDTGNVGSLRGRLGQSTEPGARIGFFTSNFPAQTITLALGELAIPATANGLFIDASNLTGPVTISGNNASRVFNIASGASVAMHSVRIVNGLGPTGAGSIVSKSGGGIRNSGTCTLLSSTVSGNSAESIGGGIGNSGTFTVHASTLSGNTAPFGGGGIYNNGNCTVLSSTITGHSVISGGGIYNEGTCSVTSSTVSGNTASSSGGGLFHNNSMGAFYLSHSIVAGNSAPSSANIANTLTTNINNLTSGDALLAPLGDYGGPTQTMALRPGSPARDAAGPGDEVQQIDIGGLPVSFTLTFNGFTTGALNQSSSASAIQSALAALPGIGVGNVIVEETTNLNISLSRIFKVTFTVALAGRNLNPITSSTVGITTLRDGFRASARAIDQRGFPTVGTPDLGAYEAGTLANYNAFIWETLPNTATAPQLAATFDFDGDGQNNGSEFSAGTSPIHPTSVFRVTSLTRSGGNLIVSFPSVTGKTYTLWRSDTLGNDWVNTGLTPITGNGSVRQFSFPAPVIGIPERFYRVQVGP